MPSALAPWSRDETMRKRPFDQPELRTRDREHRTSRKKSNERSSGQLIH